MRGLFEYSNDARLLKKGRNTLMITKRSQARIAQGRAGGATITTVSMQRLLIYSPQITSKLCKGFMLPAKFEDSAQLGGIHLNNNFTNRQAFIQG